MQMYNWKRYLPIKNAKNNKSVKRERIWTKKFIWKDSKLTLAEYKSLFLNEKTGKALFSPHIPELLLSKTKTRINPTKESFWLTIKNIKNTPKKQSIFESNPYISTLILCRRKYF